MVLIIFPVAVRNNGVSMLWIVLVSVADSKKRKPSTVKTRNPTLRHQARSWHYK